MVAYLEISTAMQAIEWISSARTNGHGDCLKLLMIQKIISGQMKPREAAMQYAVRNCVESEAREKHEPLPIWT